MSYIVENRQHATPLVISDLKQGSTVKALTRVALSKQVADGEQHDEAWLQRLIHRFPNTLPISEIEPAFGKLISVCMELPTTAGYADNLFLSISGDLVIAECKLWRNPEARREVVAQTIDYAQSISKWTYEELEHAVKDAGVTALSLYQIVEEHTELSEADFADSISRNLRLGRVHLMIVGDGVREGVESLTQSIQQHAGFHFTLSLVEMPIYLLPQGDYLLVPRILARTTNIERGIVKLTDHRLEVEPADQKGAGLGAKPSSISQESIVEAINENAPGVMPALEEFLAHASEHGVFMAPQRKSLVLKWHGPEERDFSLGGVNVKGKLISYNVNWAADEIGHIDLAHNYLEKVASLVGGSVRKTKTPAQWYVVRDGEEPPAIDVLLRRKEWMAVIQEYTSALRKILNDG